MSWEDFFRYPIEHLPFIALVLIIAFTVHEFAHAYSAYKFGDDTAYNAGRVTLNPMVHLDFFGTLLILIAGFGWAKPVPVIASKFRNPKLMSMIVSALGPLSNLILGIIGIMAMVIGIKSGFLYSHSTGVNQAMEIFLSYHISLNFMLFVFNLIPLPPLDGYRIVSELLPLQMRIKLDQNVQWGMFIFLLIVFIPPLREVTLVPLFRFVDELALSISLLFMRIL